MLIRFIASLLPVLALVAKAAAPPNDLCQGAEVIPGAGPFPVSSAVADIKEATSVGDPGVPGCASFTVTNSVWYRFTPSATHKYILSVGTDTATTVLDTVMAVYTNTSGCGASMTPLLCSDDDSGDTGLQSAISASLTANVTYYIVVWTTSISPLLSGQSMIQLRVSKPEVPVNDSCAGAEVIPANGPFPYLTSITDTSEATTSGDPASACWPVRIRSVWYRFTPEVTAPYELTLCTNTGTTIYETLLAVYTAESPCSAFTQIACNHTNPCSNKLRSSITTPLTNGVTYYVVAWEGDDQPFLGESDLQLRVNRFLSPTVTTLAPNGITSTGAVLHASVSPNGLPTHAWFEYGLTTNYGTATTPASLGSGLSLHDFQSAIGVAAFGMPQHFRIVATNSIGTSRGIDRTFLWDSSAPVFTAIQRTNTGFALQFLGAPLQWYAMEASTNLTTWDNLGISQELGGGLFQSWVPNSEPQQYFRVRAP